jgi:hypothetical protein
VDFASLGKRPTTMQTDDEWAQNLQKIISRSRPQDRPFRKLNPVNDLFKLIIEEIKDHQFKPRIFLKR